MYSFENLNQTLIGMSHEILKRGVWREVRGHMCLEIPHPVLIEITNPTDRYVTIPQRKWNKYLPFAESLWMALGMNDLDALPGRYVKNLYNYSDDGWSWRGGYGPRLRCYSGMATDYRVSDPEHRHIVAGYIKTVDQIRYVVLALKRDINTRQAIIQLGDPPKDDFDEHNRLKETKDYPCSRTLQFMMVNGQLNLTLYIRSNDILYGLSAVNVTNFTMMQEYVANILGVPVGRYYHFANNLHVYKEQHARINEFANLDPGAYPTAGRYQYADRFKNLSDFDNKIKALYMFERMSWRSENDNFISFNHNMIDDWARVFLRYRGFKHEFKNPYLNQLFDGS